MFSAVANGKYDAAVYPSPPFKEIKEKLKLAIKQSDPVSITHTYFALAKNQTALAARIDEALRQIKTDGRIIPISEKYFGENVFQLAVPK